jgi:hypothetical protein
MKDAIGIALVMPAWNSLLIRYFSITYSLGKNLYPFYLHDLSFGLHAECLYFPD